MHPPMRQIGTHEFPALLREIPDAPKSLYIQGSLPDEDLICLSVIGSRRMSAYGKRVCEQLIEGLAGYPIAIVSGLALGLDSVAHESALKASLPTIAVLPSGLGESVIYPATHRPLAKRILESGGALISEYGASEKPREWSFAARNRIVAGLSRATLVIEAAERSGTSITTRLALDYNRDVLAVPHPIGSESGLGTNSLIRSGATLIRSTKDILEALGLEQNHATDTYILNDLGEDEKILYHALTQSLERSDLFDRTGLPAQRVNVALSMLIIKGIVREEMGKIVRV